MTKVIPKSELFKITHGLRNHPLYDVWGKIKARCYNIQSKDYTDYGGRGISVCTEWIDDFKAFYDWCIENGYQKGLEIDRRNNNGNYEPDSCRMVTRSQNMRNTRRNNNLTYNGETKCLSEWAEIYGIKRFTLFGRINRMGWDIEKALTTPTNQHLKK